MSTKIVNIKKEPCDIRIDFTSGSIFSNPFDKFDHKDITARMLAIWNYLVEHLLEKLDILQEISTLKDKRLGCYCKPDPCHGDILVYYADNPDKLKEAIDKTKSKYEIAKEIFDLFKWEIPKLEPEIKTNPDELRCFYDLLTKNRSEYRPFLFALAKNGKDPTDPEGTDKNLKGSWKDRKLSIWRAIELMKQGYNIGIAAADKDPLCIVDVDDLEQVGEVKPTLICQSRKRIGQHCFYFTNDKLASSIFDDSCKQNIACDDAGEVRANWQYVVAPGSYVPCSEEEIRRIPEEDRHNAGKYTVMIESEVSSLTYSELPEVLKITLEDKRAARIAGQVRKDGKKEREKGKIENDKNKSALWSLDIHDITRIPNNKGKRFEMPAEIHGSETGKNASVSDDLLHCWRHGCSHNAITYLAVASGVSTCGMAGFPHGGGYSNVDTQDPETCFKIWKYAKEKGYVTNDDPIPTAAMIWYALEHKLCEKKDIEDGWKLPIDVYNKVIEECEKEGINTGRNQSYYKKEEKKEKNEKKNNNSDDEEDDNGISFNTQDNAGLAIRILSDGFMHEYKPVISLGGALYVYDTGAYLNGELELSKARKFIEDDLAWNKHGLGISTSNADKVLKRIIDRVAVAGQDVDNYPERLVTKNGTILNVLTGEVFPPNPEEFHTIWINVNYDPDAKITSDFENYLKSTFRGVEWEIPIVQEMLGYCLYKGYFKEVFFFLIGDGKGGKSVIINLITKLLGNKNISAMTLHEITHPRDQFALINLRGKMANVCGETGTEKIKNLGNLKRATGRDIIAARDLYKSQVKFYSFAKMIFSMNNPPVIDDGTLGARRRYMIIDFPNRFGKEKSDDFVADKFLEQKLFTDESISGILNWALEGLRRLITEGEFSDNRSESLMAAIYEKKSNPVREFIKNHVFEMNNNKVLEESINEVYTYYARLNKLPSLKKKDFKDQLISECADIGITVKYAQDNGDGRKRYFRGIGLKGIKELKRDFDLFKNGEKIKTSTPEPEEEPELEDTPDQQDYNEPAFKEWDEMSLKEKCQWFLNEHPEYNNVTATTKAAAKALIKYDQNIGLTTGLQYVIDMMAICKNGCRSDN